VRDPDHNHEGHIAALSIAIIISLGALFVSLGPCFLHDNLTTKVDHLERRLDNIQDNR
jgi:hypothetical protein